MKWMIESSIRFRGLVVAFAVGLIILGTIQLIDAPVDALPEFKPTIVEVQTEALGLSAEEVEQLITVPLEQDLLNGVAFLQDIESVSLPGLSSVVLTFESGTDLLDARQVVAERLTQAVGVAGLPEVGKPPQMLQPLSSTNRVAIVRLIPRDLTPIQASVLARWVIVPRLLGVEGVANVSIFGQRDRQLQVLVDPARLHEQGVRLSQIVRSTGNALEVSPLSFLEASQPGTGGFIDTANQRFQIFHEQVIKTAEQLADVPLEDEEGNTLLVNARPVTLGQVADVVEDHQPLIGDALCSDGGCQLLVVEKFPGANTVAVANGIEEVVEAMRPGLAGLHIDTSIYRPADYISSGLVNLGTTVLIGAILAVAALAAFLFSWRRALVVVFVLAASLGGMGVVLALAGQTLNLMIFAGLVVGLLVVIDDSVVQVSGLTRELHAQDASGRIPVTRRIRTGLAQSRSSMLYAAIIVGVAVAPVFFMEGVLGAFLPPVLASYLLAVAVSLVVALSLTAALGALVLDGDRTPPFVQGLHRAYDERLAARIGRPGPAVMAFTLVLAVGGASLLWLRPSMDPALQERDIVVELEAAPGTSLLRMRSMAAEMVAALAEVPGVRTVGAHVGRAITSDKVANVNEAEVWINLDSTVPYRETLVTIEQIARGNPALSAEMTTHSQQQIDELLARPDDDVVVRVYGENEEILEEKAAEIRQLMGGIDGVADLDIDAPLREQSIRVRVDLAAAQAVGLKPGDVRRQAAILLNGITVGNLFDEQKVFDVVVWGVPELRESPANFENLLIRTESFGPVRLGSVASVDVVSSPTQIRHESVFTYLDVTAGAEGRAGAEVVRDVESVVDQVTFPLEYHAEVLGAVGERRVQRWLMTALWTAAALFVFLLLQAALNSWRLAGAVLVVLAMAVAGGLAAAWVAGGTIGLGSVAGLFGIFGLAVRQSILTIGHYQRLQREEGRPFGPDLVVRGTRDRLAPLLTTPVAGLVFLLPMALRSPGPGLEIVQPMAVVLIGGLVAIAILVAIVLPALYLRFGDPEDALIWGEELFDISLVDLDGEPGVGVKP
jgi:Cu/Ag efflux pump CusA